MTAPESHGEAMVPVDAPDLAAAPGRPAVLMPGGPVVAVGASAPRSRAFVMGAVTVMQLGMYSAIVVQVISPNVFAGIASALFGGVALVSLRGVARRWLHTRRLEHTPAFIGAQPSRGQTVRLTGVVQPSQPPLHTRGGRAAVLIRYQGCRGFLRGPAWASPWFWELHAVDFCIRLDDGQEVWVDRSSIVLLPHPPFVGQAHGGRSRVLYQQLTGHPRGPLSWIYDEEVIAPGDRVEVAGTLDLVPHPDSPAGSDRQPRLRPVLRGTPGHPVRIRRHFLSLA